MAVSISISITQNSQSIANNTSNVKVDVVAKWTGGSWNATGQCHGSITIDGEKYSFTGLTFNSGQTASGSQTVMTKTVNVSHNSDGTKTLNCSASFATYVSSGTVSASATKTLTTIPRKSSLSVGNGTLGTAQTLTVTRQANSFTHTIVATCGSNSVTICTKATSTSISFTPPISWASQNTVGVSVSVSYTITTYNGNTNVGSNSYAKSCSIPASVKPSCSVSVSDPMGYANAYGSYLKGLSKFAVVVTTTTSYDSPIASYRTNANGATYSTSSFTTGVLTNSGTLAVTAEVWDKRNRKGTDSVNVTVIDYTAPIVSSVSVHRCNEDGTSNDQGEYVRVVFSGAATSLSNKNTAKYTIEYKKTTETNYTAVELTDYSNRFEVTDGAYIFAADSGSSYNVRVTVADNFGSNTRATTASTGFTIMHWLASGLGMAIGKIAELTNVLDIGFKTRFSGGILHPVLEPETDLNDVRTPNTYVGENVSTNNYGNCPLTSGTFTLEVVGMGEDGQVKQRLTYCHKTAARAMERIYYASTWGEWVCVSDFDGELLWEGGYYMTGEHTAPLGEPISRQKSGIVLVFSRYANGEALDQDFNSAFIPKTLVSLKNGALHSFQLCTGSATPILGLKFLYIYDEEITGYKYNGDDAVASGGLTFKNGEFVLRYVIGV